MKKSKDCECKGCGAQIAEWLDQTKPENQCGSCAMPVCEKCSHSGLGDRKLCVHCDETIDDQDDEFYDALEDEQ